MTLAALAVPYAPAASPFEHRIDARFEPLQCSA
jgi:hypothetical protein